MKVFRKLSPKNVIKSTLRNVGIGIILGMAYYFSIVFGWLRFYSNITPNFHYIFWDTLPIFLVSAIINFLIGKTVKGKILNTFIVGVIACVTVSVFIMIQMYNAFQGW